MTATNFSVSIYRNLWLACIFSLPVYHLILLWDIQTKSAISQWRFCNKKVNFYAPVNSHRVCIVNLAIM